MKNGERKYYLSSLAFSIDKTARVWELLVRNYYKDYVKDKKSILELDEFIILTFIKFNPNTTQSDISRELLKGKAHIGKILANMETKGYIIRESSIEKNIMVKKSIITPLGHKLINITDNAFFFLAENASNIFTNEEVLLLSSMLDKYRKNIIQNNKIEF